MGLSAKLLTALEEIAAIQDPWRELADSVGAGGWFAGPDWLLPWWDCYREALGATLAVVSVRHGGRLVGLAPLYLRVVERGDRVVVRELRLMGDVGPRPGALDLLVARGWEERAAAAIGGALDALAPRWDLMDLHSLRDPSRARAFLVQHLDTRGRAIESLAAGGAWRITVSRLTIAAGASAGELSEAERVRVFPGVVTFDDAVQAYCDVALAGGGDLGGRGLPCTAESSSATAAGDLGLDARAALARKLVGASRSVDRVRIPALYRGEGAKAEPLAAALVIDDGERAAIVDLVVRAREEGAGERLLAAITAAAQIRGRRTVHLPGDLEQLVAPPMPTARLGGIRLRILNAAPPREGAQPPAGTADDAGASGESGDPAHRRSPAPAAVALRSRDGDGGGAEGADGAEVPAYGRFHLYRGELWIQGLEPTEGLTLATFTEAQLDGLDPEERAQTQAALELDEPYCREKWRRGDCDSLARIDGRPAGIAWAARTVVHVPALSREVRPGPHEAYIQDVFVAPWARGRRVAPTMLEFLAQALRQMDVYRAWALIEPENVASLRAFERAAYTAVADVIYSRGTDDCDVGVRPPDAQARHLLGLDE